MTKIGSTKKGVGAAAIQRIERNPDAMNIADVMLKGTPLEQYLCSVTEYNEAVDRGNTIQIEGAQGYSLSMYHGFYPYCTSRDVTPAQTLADCGVPISRLNKVFGTLRTYPIRVANRFDGAGNMVGWSGPHYPDQKEITFNELGVETELTTVTKLPRRVFTFSNTQLYEAVRQCEPDELFLNFANYIKDTDSLISMIVEINKVLAGINNANWMCAPYVRFAGFGPTVDDILELPDSIDPIVIGSVLKARRKSDESYFIGLRTPS
jgi:adenylosuccinate synthase